MYEKFNAASGQKTSKTNQVIFLPIPNYKKHSVFGKRKLRYPDSQFGNQKSEFLLCARQRLLLILFFSFLNKGVKLQKVICDNANERCAYFPAKVAKFHHNFPDSAKAIGTETEITAVFREVRDLIKVYSQAFIAQHIEG